MLSPNVKITIVTTGPVKVECKDSRVKVVKKRG